MVLSKIFSQNQSKQSKDQYHWSLRKKIQFLKESQLQKIIDSLSLNLNQQSASEETYHRISYFILYKTEIIFIF